MAAVGYINNANMTIVLELLDRATKPLEKAEKQMNNFGKSTGKMNMALLSAGLGLKFQFMNFNRIFNSFFKSAIDGYTKITGNTSTFTLKTNELNAAWEFFKFSLIDALGQSPLFVKLIDFVIGIINALGKLSDKDRQKLVNIGVGLFVYQLLKAHPSVWILVASLATIAAIVGTLNSDMPAFEKVLLSVGLVAGGLGMALLFINLMLGLKLLLIAAIIIGIVLLARKFGGVGNAIKAMVGVAIMALGFLGQFIVEGILFPLQVLAALLVRLVALFNKVTGASISTKMLEDFAEYKPDIVGKAAQFADLAGFNPQPVTETPVADITRDIAGGFVNAMIPVVEKIGDSVGKAVGDAMDKSFRENKTVLSSTSG
ncbi:hypothetical protein HYU06_05830 [Candidatus Woesearchaeota archaeon]|nr:hypothetical protein [Candidatus Woesearchaeota archaeon]